jgi:hypothetical protein
VFASGFGAIGSATGSAQAWPSMAVVISMLLRNIMNDEERTLPPGQEKHALAHVCLYTESQPSFHHLFARM